MISVGCVNLLYCKPLCWLFVIQCSGSTTASGQCVSANRKTFAWEQRETKNCEYIWQNVKSVKALFFFHVLIAINICCCVMLHVWWFIFPIFSITVYCLFKCASCMFVDCWGSARERDANIQRHGTTDWSSNVWQKSSFWLAGFFQDFHTIIWKSSNFITPFCDWLSLPYWCVMALESMHCICLKNVGIGTKPFHCIRN